MAKEVVNGKINISNIHGRVIKHDLWLNQALHTTDSPTFANISITGDTVVGGSLYVLGNATIIDSNLIEFDDNILVINRQETGAGVTLNQAGIEIERGSEENYRIVYNETSDTIRIGLVSNTQAVATRQDAPLVNGVVVWNDTENRLDTTDTIEIPVEFTSDVYVLGNIQCPNFMNVSGGINITSMYDISLSSSLGNVLMPLNQRLAFGSTTQSIRSDTSDNMYLTAGGNINFSLPYGKGINIPNEVPIVFANNGMVYTDLNNNLSLASGHDIILQPNIGHNVLVPYETGVLFGNTRVQGTELSNELFVSAASTYFTGQVILGTGIISGDTLGNIRVSKLAFGDGNGMCTSISDGNMHMYGDVIADNGISFGTMGYMVSASGNRTLQMQVPGYESYGFSGNIPVVKLCNAIEVSEYGSTFIQNISVNSTAMFFTTASFVGGIDMQNARIQGLPTPLASNEAATKEYVDLVKQGLYVKDSVDIATVTHANLATEMYIGCTIDNYVVTVGNRILIKDQIDKLENGLYFMSSSGSAERSSDLDNGESASGIFVFVKNGDTNKSLGWICNSVPGDDLVGIDDITFTEFTGLGQVVAGNGLVKTFNTLDVNVDNSSIEVDSFTDTLRIKNTCAGTGLTGGSGSPLSTLYDQSHVTVLGTIGTGRWEGTVVTIPYGGTGSDFFTHGNFIYGDGTSGMLSVPTLSCMSSGSIRVSGGSLAVYSQITFNDTAVIFANTNGVLTLTSQSPVYIHSQINNMCTIASIKVTDSICTATDWYITENSTTGDLVIGNSFTESLVFTHTSGVLSLGLLSCSSANVKDLSLEYSIFSGSSIQFSVTSTSSEWIKLTGSVPLRLAVSSQYETLSFFEYTHTRMQVNGTQESIRLVEYNDTVDNVLYIRIPQGTPAIDIYAYSTNADVKYIRDGIGALPDSYNTMWTVVYDTGTNTNACSSGNTVSMSDIDVFGNVLAHTKYPVFNYSPVSVGNYGIGFDRHQTNVISDPLLYNDNIPIQTGLDNDKIKFSTSASAIVDIGMYIKINTGPCIGRVAEIVEYNSGTQVATLSPGFNGTIPSIGDSVSVYSNSYSCIIYDETDSVFKLGYTNHKSNLNIQTLAGLDVNSMYIDSPLSNSIYTNGGAIVSGEVSIGSTLRVAGGVTSGSLCVSSAAPMLLFSTDAEISFGDSLRIFGGVTNGIAVYQNTVGILSIGTNGSLLCESIDIVTGNISCTVAPIIVYASSSSSLLIAQTYANIQSDLFNVSSANTRVQGVLEIQETLAVTGSVVLNCTTESIGIGTGGCLTVAGGVSIGKDTYIGGDLIVNGSINISGQVTFPVPTFSNTVNCTIASYYNSKVVRTADECTYICAVYVLPALDSFNTQFELDLPGRSTVLTNRNDIIATVSGYTDDTNIVSLFNTACVGIAGTTRILVKFQNNGTGLHYLNLIANYTAM